MVPRLLFLETIWQIPGLQFDHLLERVIFEAVLSSEDSVPLTTS